jgi:hypothetical protein
MALMIIPVVLVGALAYVISTVYRKTSAPSRIGKGLRNYVAACQ